MPGNNIEKKILIYLFYSPSNGESQIIRNMLKKIVSEKNDVLTLREVDFDNEKDMCNRFRVYGIPTLIIQAGQNEIQRFSGVLNVEEVKKIINESLVKRN
jgi:thioredoxin-like negative regulator of GroEL